MRFQKPFIINSTNYDKILKGEIRIQTGQWVYFWDETGVGATNGMSRWVGVTAGGTMWATHTTNPEPFRRLAARIKEVPYSYASVLAEIKTCQCFKALQAIANQHRVKEVEYAVHERACQLLD